jgi:hypothetical protein
MIDLDQEPRSGSNNSISKFNSLGYVQRFNTIYDLLISASSAGRIVSRLISVNCISTLIARPPLIGSTTHCSFQTKYEASSLVQRS